MYCMILNAEILPVVCLGHCQEPALCAHGPALGRIVDLLGSFIQGRDG